MTNKKKRIIRSPQFKVEALKLSENVEVAAAASQLSLRKSLTCDWRKVVKKYTMTSQRETTHQELYIKVKEAFGNNKG
ncbi:hypothetical protein PY199_002485 [Vibrio cholerae]|nr:hypothetical protein [Vibrio cholerae]EGR5448067.1 hypothetical protein [Vibrio cholerae]EGR5456064.1 hypothetical protein [Vibrio cholerae]EGR5464095.1 hypothetical protein [Vibrio cholerae]EKN8282708.1 hypothetical protein [Vibrio cholerae]